jgi:tetratricopeptide (TPR) repeat protein
MNPEIENCLNSLREHPRDQQILRSLEDLVSSHDSVEELLQALASSREHHKNCGNWEVVVGLIDLELPRLDDESQRVELLGLKGRVLQEELLEEEAALEAFNGLLSLRPDDEETQETLEHIRLIRDNWEKVSEKYVDEAESVSDSDRQLATSLFLSAAEVIWRNSPGDEQVEQLLRRSLEVEPRNHKASSHLERLLRRQERFAELAELYDQRADVAATRDDRVAAFLAAADLYASGLEDLDEAAARYKNALSLDPTNPRALRYLVQTLSAQENWTALLRFYEGALRGRPQGPQELQLLLQMGSLYAEKLEQPDQAEEYYRRVRKIAPTNMEMLEFYRRYYRDRGETGKILALLDSAQRAEQDLEKRALVAMEMANVAEEDVGNLEKAIDIWKGIQRMVPAEAQVAVAALKRLYRLTEPPKWNALRELIKDEIEGLDKEQVEEKIALLMEVVEIYRDHLRLDVMVINTYNAILALRPDHLEALDALTSKYESLGRWNDLIGLLLRRKEAQEDPAQQVKTLHRVASLWIDKFGNQSQAIKPLNEILQLDSTEREAMARLREIYEKRRNWRELMELYRLEAAQLEGSAKRALYSEMARMAAEKLGEPKEGIQVWNQVLEDDPADAEALAELTVLYRKEGRWPALAEVLHRRVEAALGGEEADLEAGEEEHDNEPALELLQELGDLYTNQLRAVDNAIQVWQQVLALRADSPKAKAVLRELYVQEKRWDELERLLAGREEFSELAEALTAAADRSGDDELKVQLYTRVGEICQRKLDNPERAIKSYERVMATAPTNTEVASALVPLYESTERWGRLLASYEILHEHAETDERRLELIEKVQRLYETHLESVQLAFTWSAKAYAVAPEREDLRQEMERLAEDAEAWEDLVQIYVEQVQSIEDDERKSALLRNLAQICIAKLHRPEDAEVFYRDLLELEPQDLPALESLEQIYTSTQRWDGLVDVFRRRAVLEEDEEMKLGFLFKVSFIQEERVGDPDAAIQTLKEVLDLAPENLRALSSLARLYEVRGEWFPLVEVFRKELALEDEKARRVEILCRMGEILQAKLEATEEGINALAAALELDPVHRGTVQALEVHLEGEGAVRERVALLLRPFYERSEDWQHLVTVLEVLLEAEDDREARIELYRRLMLLQERRFDNLDAAFAAGSHVLSLAPADDENRQTMARLAEGLDRQDELATLMADALHALQEEDGSPELERTISWELAQVLDEQLGQPEEAERHLRRIIEIDQQHTEAFELLERILRDAGSWSELRDLLERRKELTAEADARRDILLQISALNENVLEEIPAAIASYEQILELDPHSSAAIQSLERHYAGEERWRDLLGLLRREMDLAEDERAINGLKVRQAELMSEHLEESEGAVDLLEEVTATDPGQEAAVAALEELMGRDELRQRITEILEPVYDRLGSWQDLVRVLLVRREGVEDRFEALELLCRVARLEEERLEEPGVAFSHYREALKLDSAALHVHDAIQRLSRQLECWEEAAESWEQALEAADPDDMALRARLLKWVAVLYDERLEQPVRAREAFERLLELDPSSPETARPATTALTRLYEQEGKWAPLIDVLRRQIEWAVEPSAREELLLRIGKIHEDVEGNIDAAVETYRELLDEGTGSTEALDALERLYLHTDRWSELVEIYRRRVELAESSDERRYQWLRIAGICEEELQDQDQAVAAYLTVLDETPGDLESIRALARIYRAGKRWPDLLEMIERELQLEEEAEPRLTLLFEAATIEHRELSDAALALNRYKEIIEIEASHSGTREALEELLEQPEHRPRVAELLTPVYKAEHDFERLIKVHELQAEAADPSGKIRHLEAVAQLYEEGLDNLEQTFDAYRRALVEAATEPELEGLVDQLHRVTRALERWSDFVDALEAVVPDVLDAGVQQQIHLTAARIAAEELRDLERARDHYRQVLDAEPDNAGALEALDEIFGQLEQWESLLEIISRRAELADGTEEKQGLLVRVAITNRDMLERPAEAIAAYEQALELTSGAPDLDVVQALDNLYVAAERWVELDELLTRQLDHAEDSPARAALYFRLGQLRADKLEDAMRAVEAYREVLVHDPSQAEVVTALEAYLEDADLQAEAAKILEPYYVSRQDWNKLIRIYQIRLDSAEGPEQRLSLTTRIAQLFEEQLEDLEGAFKWYSRVFLETPEDVAIRDQVLRLAGILDRWQEVAEVLAKYLDGTFDENETTRTVAVILGNIYDERLYQVEPAVACFNRVLGNDRLDQDAFDLQESLLTRAERWEELLELYRETSVATDEDATRRELLLKICRVWEEALDNLPEAIDAYRVVLDLVEDDEDAVSALDRLYNDTERWPDLCDLLNRRCDAAEDQDEVIEIKHRLGTIYELRLEDLPAAIDHFEEVLQLDPEHLQAVSALERLILDRDQRFRIAQILEPIYQAQDEWAKLVVIFDAQLDFIDDHDRRGHLLREIARLHEERGGSLELAFRALCRAFEEEFGDPQLLERIEQLAERLNNWQEVVDLLVQGVDGLYDNDLLARTHAKIARLQEERLGDQSAAVESWRQVLAAREEDGDGIEALIRLLAALERNTELIEILQRKAEQAMELEVQKPTYYRIAEIYETVLDNPERAVETYRQVLALDENDRLALDALDRLFVSAENWIDLIWIYRQKLELCESDGERRELQLSVARVYEGQLEDAFEAITAYKLVLEHDPSDREILDALDRLYTGEGLHSDLLEIVEQKTDGEQDPDARNELLARAGTLMEHEIGDIDGAARRYTQVIEADTDHAQAREALERLVQDETHRERVAEVLEKLYLALDEVSPLVAVLELRLELMADPAGRRDLLVRIGHLQEEGLDDPRGAFEAYARAFSAAPDNEEVQRELERLAAALELLAELADVYERRLDDLFDMALNRALRLKVARLAEEELQDDPRAEDHYRAVLDNDGDDIKTLRALDGVLARQEKWYELVEILEREIQAEPKPTTQAELFFRMGEVRLREHEDLDGAFSAFREALEREASHQGARDAMETLLANETYRTQVLDVLEPIYEESAEHAKVVELLETRLSTVVDPTDRTGLLERIAVIHEEKIGSKDDALGALGRAMAEDPTSERILDGVERLATELSRYQELVALSDEILSGELPADAARALGLRTAEWYGARLSDVERSERALRRVLEIDPECGGALDGLERIYRAGGESEQLAEVLARQADHELDAAQRRGFFVELAHLRLDDLEDVDGAVSAWRQVLEADPADGEALTSLVPLLERKEAWEDLLDALDRQAQLVDDPAAGVPFKLRAGDVLVQQLEDHGRAVEIYRDVLDLVPGHEPALESLESIYILQQEWTSLQEVLMLRLEQHQGEARIAVLIHLAELCLEKLERIDEAVGFYHQVLEIEPAHSGALRDLEATLRKAERWYDLVEALRKHAGACAAEGDVTGEVEQLAAAARVWNDELENPEAAGEVLEEILKRDEGNITALAGLARIYESVEQWDKCRDVLQRAADLGPEPKQAAELEFRMGRIKAVQDGDIEAALEHYVHALESDPGHAEAAEALEQHYREAADWSNVAAILELRLEQLEEQERHPVLCELGRLFGEELGQADKGVEMLEAARAIKPDDAEVLAALADGYYAADRLDEAEPILEHLIELAGNKRRKAMARYVHRLGAIAEKRGDVESARERYDKAYKMDSTNGPTLVALGRIYEQQEDWTSARRIYRSMLLQNMDEKSGITKADVFYHLGLIHAAMDERHKAKSMFERGLEVDPDHAQLLAALEEITG